MSRQAEQQARDQLAALEQTLARTKSDEPRLREAIRDLEAASALLRVAGLPAEREPKTLAGVKLS